MDVDDKTRAKLKKMWEERVEKKQREWEPPPVTPSTIGPVGTRVRVTSIDPDWNYAGCGHAALGSEGVISDHLCPEGKSSVAFPWDDQGRMYLTDGSYFSECEEDPDPITLFLPDECLEVVDGR